MPGTSIEWSTLGESEYVLTRKYETRVNISAWQKHYSLLHKMLKNLTDSEKKSH